MVEEKDERLKDDSNPNDILISHLRDWRDYQNREYADRLEVWESEVQKAVRHQQNFRTPSRSLSSQRYWQQIYQNLSDYDGNFLVRVLSTFHTLGETKKMDRDQLAKAIVACVQDIPYTYIYRRDCEEAYQKKPSLRGTPCKGNVDYGLQSPSTFIGDLKGDCDTRTVFLFTILNKLGYKVAILNSDVYAHSMLGLEMNAVGKYKAYRGRNYYFWETTATGWKPGVIPPKMGTPKDWYVVLAN